MLLTSWAKLSSSARESMRVALNTKAFPHPVSFMSIVGTRKSAFLLQQADSGTSFLESWEVHVGGMYPKITSNLQLAQPSVSNSLHSIMRSCKPKMATFMS